MLPCCNPSASNIGLGEVQRVPISSLPSGGGAAPPGMLWRLSLIMPTVTPSFAVDHRGWHPAGEQHSTAHRQGPGCIAEER